jgi:type I restriction enzyme, S subunit
VLVSCIGNLGKIAISSTPVAFNQQINAILPNHEAALPRFTFYHALSARFRGQLEDVAACTTVPIVNKTKFNSVTVSLAPLADQASLAIRALQAELAADSSSGELTAKEAEKEMAAA